MFTQFHAPPPTYRYFLQVFKSILSHRVDAFRLSSAHDDCRFCLDDALETFTFGIRTASQHSQRPHRSEEHTSELQSQSNLVCRLLLEKKNNKQSTCVKHIQAKRRDRP